MSTAESGQAGNSDAESGQVQGSEQQGDKQTSQQAPAFTADQEKLIEEIARRSVQAKEDRATARLEKTVTEQQTEIEKIAAMVKSGMNPDQINRELAIDKIIQGQSQPAATTATQPASTNAGTQQAAAPVDYPAIYKTLGMDANDAEVIRLTVENPQPNALKVALVDLKAKREASGQSVSAGAVMQPSGGGAPNSTAKIEQLATELAAMQNQPGVKLKDVEAKQKELDAALASAR